MNIDSDKLILEVKRELKSYKRFTISLDILYEIVSDVTNISKSDLHTSYAQMFRDIINLLIQNECISKRGTKTDGIGVSPLNINYYNLLKEKRPKLSEEDKLFLHGLNKEMDTTSYFRNIDKFKKDKLNLKIMSDYLDNITDETEFMGINERSYDLFGYEKELLNEDGGLLKQVKISPEKLKCFEQYTPLQCHIFKHFYTKESRLILIFENLNTYKSMLLAALNTSLGEQIDMVIYGGGNTISGNFRQHIMYGINENDTIYYFGDIDPAGIAIYKRVKEFNNDLNIKLCNDLYKLAIKIGKSKGIHDIHNENQAMIDKDDIDNLLLDLDEDVANDFKEIIYNGKYIPQEAVNYSVLINEINKTQE